MLAGEAQQAMKTWLSQAPSPEQQLDHRWIGRYRELTSRDSFWWLSWAGPFTEEEQQQWDSLSRPPVDEATKVQLGLLLKQSRERELEEALAEQREPRLCYPAIEIDDVRNRITALIGLNIQIEQKEPNTVVRQLYHGAIENDVDYLRLIEATYEGNHEQYWACNKRMFHQPTSDEMTYAFSWVRRLIQQGFEQPETAEISQQLIDFMREQLYLSLDLSMGKDDPPVAYEYAPDLRQRGICFLQDATYLRGLLLVDGAVTNDKRVLDQLAIGKIACDLLPILEPLQMVPPPQPLRDLAYDPDLDNYIVSFATHEKEVEKIV